MNNDTTLIELAPGVARPNPLGTVARRLVLSRMARRSFRKGARNDG